RLPRREARPRGLDRLLDDPLRDRGVLVQEDPEPLVDDLRDRALDLRVPELRLRLALELRLPDLEREDARQPLPDIIARERVRVLLEQAVLLRVVVQRTRERGLEAGQVRAALVRVDVVDEGERVFVVALVVLDRDLDLGLVPLRLDVDRLRVERLPRAAEEGDELLDPAFVAIDLAMRLFALRDAFIGERDLEALVQERQLAEPGRQRLEVEREFREDLRVRLERDRRAGPPALVRADGLELRHLRPAREALAVELPVAPADLDLEPLRERVDDAHAHAVQTAGDLVGILVELAAGVQHRHRDLDAGDPLDRMLVDRDPTAVVGDGDRAVLAEDDLDL